MSDMKKYLKLFESAEKGVQEEVAEAEEEYVEIEDEFILPSHWGPALVNGDYSGLSDEEEAEINSFLEDFPLAHSIVGVGEELGFRSYNDANRMGGDVSLFKAYKRVKKSEANDELLEGELKIGVLDNARQFKHHIAQNFDYYQKQLKLLYPKDQKDTYQIFLQFLKSQEIKFSELEELYERLVKKVQDIGGPYDVMAGFLEKLINFYEKVGK